MPSLAAQAASRRRARTRGRPAARGRSGRPSRAAHARRLAVVERIHDAREQLGPHAGGALREPVREPHHRGAHDVARGVGPGRHAVIAQQPAVVGVHLVGPDAHALAHADAGRDAVDAVGALDRPLDDRARGAHAPSASALTSTRSSPRATRTTSASVSRSPSRVTVIASQYVGAATRRVAVEAARGRIDQSCLSGRGVRWTAMLRALSSGAPGGDRPARLALLLVLACACRDEPGHLGRRRRAAAARCST